MLSIKIVLVLMILTGGVGFAIGYMIRILIALSKKSSIELDIKRLTMTAKDEAKSITLQAKEEADQIISSARQDVKHKEEDLKKNEERLIKKEGVLDDRQKSLDQEFKRVEHEFEKIQKDAHEISIKLQSAEELKAKIETELSKIAELSKEEARNKLILEVEEHAKEDLEQRLKKLEYFAGDKLQERAKDILTTSVQRLATSVPTDIFSSNIPIQSDDIKGKIIGKEGRNIKTFEKETGVDVLVDDTPGYITLSSFDPIRRHIAKMALEALIEDGRIQPAKIEKEVERAKEEINQSIKEQGERAVYEVGVIGLDPRIVAILGRLHFRTSYGQNVLRHSIECAHLAGMLAEELGANVGVAKTAALVHDIGKALDHEVVGSHVEIGIRVLEKFGANKDIITAMKSHHEEYPYESIEARIVQTADAISGSRPGARRDSLENYLKRLEELESIAKSFPGVEKCYALEAGREIRIFVSPEKVSDYEAQNMARNIAIKIERELRYPGEIKITIIRENRVVEYAR